MEAFPQKGLIIQQPHLGNILDKGKIWELRGEATTIRGDIGLCLGGKMYGIAELHNVLPLKKEELSQHADKHMVPADWPGYNQIFAWELRNVRKLSQPARFVVNVGVRRWANLQFPNTAVKHQKLLQSATGLVLEDLRSLANEAGLTCSGNSTGSAAFWRLRWSKGLDFSRKFYFWDAHSEENAILKGLRLNFLIAKADDFYSVWGVAELRSRAKDLGLAKDGQAAQLRCYSIAQQPSTLVSSCQVIVLLLLANWQPNSANALPEAKSFAIS